MLLKSIPTAALLRRAALGYLVVWVLSPPLAYGITWRGLAVAAILLWLLLELASPRSVLLRPSWPVIAAFVFVVYTVCIELIVPDARGINAYFQVWIMFFFLVVGESLDRGKDGDARFVFWLSLVLLPVWTLSTLSALDSVGAGASRLLTRSSDESRMLSIEGVGGYGFVYAGLLSLPFIAWFAVGSKAASRAVSVSRSRVAQVVLLANFALVAILIVRAGYSIALILGTLAVLLILTVRVRSGARLAISLVAVGLLFLLASITFSWALETLIRLSEGTEYVSKLRDMQYSLQGQGAVGTVEGRVERYQRSFVLFLDNPVLGTLQFDDLGKHSAILDSFAQYGLGIGLLFFALIVYMPLKFVRDPSVPLGLSLAFFLVAAVFPMVNNVFMAWGLMLYVFSRGGLVVMGVSSQQRRGSKVPELERRTNA